MEENTAVFESFYSFINMCFAWFGLANYYIFSGSSLPRSKTPLSASRVSAFSTSLRSISIWERWWRASFCDGEQAAGEQVEVLGSSDRFALLTVYMMVAAVLCLAKVVKRVEHDAIYAQMVVSLLATYGVYLISSLLACDPLHLVTTSSSTSSSPPPTSTFSTSTPSATSTISPGAPKATPRLQRPWRRRIHRQRHGGNHPPHRPS